MTQTGCTLKHALALLAAMTAFTAIVSAISWMIGGQTMMAPALTGGAVATAAICCSFLLFLLPGSGQLFVAKAYAATLLRMAIGLAAVVLLRQNDTPQYSIRLALYILAAYGFGLLLETYVIARSMPDSNPRNGLKALQPSPDDSNH